MASLANLTVVQTIRRALALFSTTQAKTSLSTILRSKEKGTRLGEEREVVNFELVESTKGFKAQNVQRREAQVEDRAGRSVVVPWLISA